MPGKKPTHTGRDATKEATGIKHEISIHAPHTGRDPAFLSTSGGYAARFQSTRPIRGATLASHGIFIQRKHFNPRAPYGARPAISNRSIPMASTFQSTRPIRGATIRNGLAALAHAAFQSPRPIRGATQTVCMCSRFFHISIHAPHTGRDARPPGGPGATEISIHAPHTGRDLLASKDDIPTSLFQSTRPIRGATASIFPARYARLHFNPRAPYGARRARG